jgi:hypothetical protein
MHIHPGLLRRGERVAGLAHRVEEEEVALACSDEHIADAWLELALLLVLVSGNHVECPVDLEQGEFMAVDEAGGDRVYAPRDETPIGSQNRPLK